PSPTLPTPVYSCAGTRPAPLTFTLLPSPTLSQSYNAANNTAVTGALPLGSSVYDKASFSGANTNFTPDITKVTYQFNGGSPGSAVGTAHPGTPGAHHDHIPAPSLLSATLHQDPTT